MKVCSASALAALIVVGCTVGAGAQTTYYVRTSGNDTNDGLTPATALKTIQAAVGKCTKSGGGYTIVVGPGTYTERVRITNTSVPLPASGTVSSPNSIVGDTSGYQTGDPGGNVVISGGGTQLYGVEIAGRGAWELVGLSFSNQTTAAISMTSSANIGVKDCSIAMRTSATYGIYCDAYNVTITGNRIVFGSTTGHGIFLRCPSTGSYTVERNCVWMTGVNYLSTSYRTNPALAVNYGIYANVPDPLTVSNISIANNVVTDRHTGIFVQSDGLLASVSVSVSSNTVVGCTIPIFESVTGTPLASATNNIVAHSYETGKFNMPLGTLSGFLSWNTVSPLSAGVLLQSGVITNQDPRFISPSSGNFRLSAGSPAIDAGPLTGSLLGSAPTVDQSGRPRPADGNSDALAVHDLGAFEYAASGGLRITAWNQKDQRTVPRFKLPDIKALKIGSVLIP